MFDHVHDTFMPHGMCYLWRPDLLALHVTSDALITLAYFSIPFTLLYFVRRRRDLEFNWMFVCFAVFIIACGTTHLMEIWTVWQPRYWLSGSVKAVTAMASVPTAVLLVKLIPQALRLPSPSTLRQVNELLENEIVERKRAESDIRRVNEELEVRVAERTAQLEAANKTLSANQRLLEAIIDNSGTVIFVKDLEGRHLLVNRRFEEIFSLTRKEVLGRTDHDLFPRAIADAFHGMDQRVVAADRALTEEEIAPQADGPHTYLSVKAPLRDELGATYAVFGISTDITERRQAEEQQRAQLERLSLLDRITRSVGERKDLGSILSVVTSNLEDHLLIDLACVCNYDSAKSAFFVTCIGAKSQQIAKEIGLKEHSRLELGESLLQRCGRGELVYEAQRGSATLTVAPELSHARLQSLVIAPLIIEDKMLGVIICARAAAHGFSSGDCEFVRQLSQHVALASNQARLYDSLQRAYDDLRGTQEAVLQHERLRVLGQMASGIAHDINNGLAPALLYVQLLLERTNLDDEFRNNLLIVQSAIDDVAHTVARMREFYRSREPQRALAPLDLNAAVQQVIDLTQIRWRDMPQEHGIVIDVKTELQADVAPILGASNEIKDAVTNLVLNAVDAMPQGGTLTLRTRNSAVGSRVTLEVSDTGIGMDEQTRSHCLEPFYTTKGERGTGLGLAMVYGMTQRHDAELHVESELGRGTTMRLVFPSARAGATLHVEQGLAAPRKRRILVIDDDPMLLKSLKNALQVVGHRVEVADGGENGIAQFQATAQGAEPFDIVITDLGMPYVDGRAVAAAIKSASPRTPVLLLTGWGHRLEEENSVPEHVDRLLCKPLKLAELRDAIAAFDQHLDSAPGHSPGTLPR